jgi:hypothetical protein
VFICRSDAWILLAYRNISNMSPVLTAVYLLTMSRRSSCLTNDEIETESWRLGGQGDVRTLKESRTFLSVFQ